MGYMSVEKLGVSHSASFQRLLPSEQAFLPSWLFRVFFGGPLHTCADPFPELFFLRFSECSPAGNLFMPLLLRHLRTLSFSLRETSVFLLLL